MASSQSCYVAGITFTLTFAGNQPEALFSLFSRLARNELFLSRLIRWDNIAGASHPTLTTAEPSESSAIKGRDGRLGDGSEKKSAIWLT